MTFSTPFAWLLLALWVWPLLLVPLAARVHWPWLPALGALPALGVALLLPVNTSLALPWLMLGSELGLDTTGKVFLLFSALLWLAAGVFVAAFRGGVQGLAGEMTVAQQRTNKKLADSTPGAGASFTGRRFNALFLLTMSGQFWAVVGLDLVSFYVGFAIMGLASYALVVADGSVTALRAGRLYLAMTVAGEVALFAGLVSLAAETATLMPAPAMLGQVSGASLALVLLGLGVKAAIVPLHLWLPLTYPAAPVAATAVLSSAMINVAVLGWLRWLPLGAVAWPDWALWLTRLGLGTAFFALAVGLMQREPKVVLAYSSISKMGFLLLLTGLMLGQPELAGVGVAAMVFYAAHHALCKAGLFLGLGLFEREHSRGPAATRVRAWLLAGLGVLALALAGAPLTSGAVAKYFTKPLLTDLPWDDSWACLSPLLWLMTLASMLLMARFMWLVSRDSGLVNPDVNAAAGRLANPAAKEVANAQGVAANQAPMLNTPLLAWSALVVVVLLLPWVFGPASSWLTNTATLVLAAGICIGVLRLAQQGRNPLRSFVGWVPPGDLLAWALAGARALSAAGLWLWCGWHLGLERAVRCLASAWGGATGCGANASPNLNQGAAQPGSASAIRPGLSGSPSEAVLRTWPVAGALWLGLGSLLLFLLVLGGMQ
ncbi:MULTISPECIES: proton-conducting transporter transmembrane domain-containing protein [Thiorhodovibrio]|uniref:proton-conducting transporter transmembrane domain-containing protein n=1 Tax=Thiorhodovibrio TaxID=61593 RepID=UPI001911C1FB|nr:MULTISPECIES: proton-conducting transporter membrane subunit [Thiorhodovibrio]MBK5970928.1 hypothetical protein [Thiorhodovibrio winogradskyi]WPL10707.1 Hydrogenase-4 component B [Thiorhodovibrio litoralis]